MRSHDRNPTAPARPPARASGGGTTGEEAAPEGPDRPDWADGDRAWFGYNGAAAPVTLHDKDGDGRLWFRNPDAAKQWMPVSIFADELTRVGAADVEEAD